MGLLKVRISESNPEAKTLGNILLRRHSEEGLVTMGAEKELLRRAGNEQKECNVREAGWLTCRTN